MNTKQKLTWLGAGLGLGVIVSILAGNVMVGENVSGAWPRWKTRTATATITRTATLTATHTPTSTPTDTSTPSATPTLTPTLANPFGVMMNLQAWPDAPAQLGARYGRNLTSIFASTYNGSCPSCDDVVEAGLIPIFNIRGNGSVGVASSPVTDTTLIYNAVITVGLTYSPSIIVYGNEVNSAVFYTGSSAQYRTELIAACDAAHSLGILCANDGPTWQGVVLGAWADYLDIGNTGAACLLMQQTQTESDAASLCQHTAWTQAPAQVTTVITKIRALLPVYAEVPDVANIHYYGSNPDAFSVVYFWFKQKVGKEVIINEFGIRENNPVALRAIMERMDALGIPIAIYYNVQGQPAFPLNDSAGVLTDLGREFADVVGSLP